MHKQGGFRSLTRLPFLVSLSLDGVPCVLPPSARVRAGFDFPSVSASLRDRAIPRLRKIDIGRMHCILTAIQLERAVSRCVILIPIPLGKYKRRMLICWSPFSDFEGYLDSQDEQDLCEMSQDRLSGGRAEMFG